MSLPDLFFQYCGSSPVDVAIGEGGVYPERYFWKGTTTRKFGSFKAYWGEPRGSCPFDAVMIADDDLVPVGCTISDMFAAFRASGARVAHPALTPDSPHAFAHSLQGGPPMPFTELMAPMFTREALIEYLPHFGETVHGWGLEQMWAHRERAAGRQVARLDATPMRHTRALGGSYNYLEAMQEARGFLKRHGIPEPEHMR